MADHKKPDDKKSETSDKKDDDTGTQNKLLEYGKTFGAIIAVVFAVLDARVRPVIAHAVEIAEQYGVRGSRIVQQLLDRHLVAFLRPFLIVSTCTVTAAYALGWRWIYAFGVDGFTALGEAGRWLFVIMAVATLIPSILIGRIWKVKGLLDAGIRRLYAQVTAEFFPRWTEEERNDLTDAQLDRVNSEVQRRMNDDFGRPGYASHIALTLFAQWAIAAAWFVWLAIVLQTWHLAEMQIAHVDPHWTSGLIVMAFVLTTGAFGWLTLAVSIAQASIKYVLRPIAWALRFTAKSAVDLFDFASKTATAMFGGMALPFEEGYHSIGAVLGFPVGVIYGMLTLLATGHSLNQAAFIVMNACVWLGVYVFLVRTGRIMNEYLYRLILIGHSVWMVVQFYLWALQPTWMAVGGIGLVAFAFANLVTPTFVAILLGVAGVATWLARQTFGTSARTLKLVAIVCAVLGVGMMLARTVYAVESPTTPAVSTASGGCGYSPGSIGLRSTVNAGSHSASNCQVMPDGSCVPY